MGYAIGIKQDVVVPFPLKMSGEAHVVREALYKANILPNGQHNPQWSNEFAYWKREYMNRYVEAQG